MVQLFRIAIMEFLVVLLIIDFPIRCDRLVVADTNFDYNYFDNK